jgi:hypothetical protein
LRGRDQKTAMHRHVSSCRNRGGRKRLRAVSCLVATRALWRSSCQRSLGQKVGRWILGGH